MAVDRGADACREAGVAPDSFCGDADTVSPETLSWLCGREGATPDDEPRLAVTPADDVRDVPEIHGLHAVPAAPSAEKGVRAGTDAAAPSVEKGVRAGGLRGVRLFEPAKYDTDLSLGFSCCRQLAREMGESLEVVVTCASGGRMDHALAVFGVLAANADLSPVLVEDDFECRILAPGHRAAWELGPDARGRHFSFVALADATCVSERGMRWELDHFHVDALRDRGISNVVERADATVTCHAGILAAFLMRA